MGLFKTMAGTVQGILILIMIASLIVFGIIYIFWGDWLLQVLGKVLLQTIIPAGVMVFGLFAMWQLGIKAKTPSTFWIITGFIIFVFGFVLAAFLGLCE